MSDDIADHAVILAHDIRSATETLGEFIHRRLRDAIMTGRIPPGRALTIRGLASALGVSSMPVREAMRRLVAERALELLDNRRVRVAPMTPARFNALLEARVLLEREAALRAMPHVTQATLDRLRQLDADDNAAVQAGNLEGAIEANFAFHRTLYSVAPADALTPLVESLWLQIGPFMRAALAGIPVYYHADRHMEALSAIETQDGAKLAAAIEADIRDGIGHLSASGALLAA